MNMSDFPNFPFFTSGMPFIPIAPNLNLEQLQYQFQLQQALFGLVPEVKPAPVFSNSSPMLNGLQTTPSPIIMEQSWNSQLPSTLLSASVSTASPSVSSECSTPSLPRDPRQNSCSPSSQELYDSARGSPEIDVCGSLKVKRGRPQQDIKDENDPTSQKKRHRRLYARDYRQKMRQQVDQVGPLREHVARMERKMAEMDAELRRVTQECANKDAMLKEYLSKKQI